MRKPLHLSPSGVSLWYRDREGYYLQHISDIRSEDSVKSYAMTIGSAFDAYVKSEMYEYVFGSGTNPQFEFDTIFEEQVVPEHRDWGIENGLYALECYKLSGAFDDLLDLVDQSQHAPQFEFTVKGDVNEIPLLGKPDLRFVHKNGAHIILDWKVSGYCSKRGVSPAKNYKLIRDGWLYEKPSRSDDTSHNGYMPFKYKELEIHKGFLEDCNKTWADQIIMYSWLLGETVGDENVVACIDQLACKPNGDFPLIRVAQHRARTSSAYQFELMSKLQTCWESIQDDYIFDNLTREESQQRCEILDRRAEFLDSYDPKLSSVHDYFMEQSKVYKF